MRRERLYRILLVIGSFSLVFLACEAFMRVVPPHVIQFIPPRLWLLSSPNFACDEEDGVVRFAKHKKVREIVIYNREIEYDVSLDTNDMGLLDDRDYGGTTSYMRRVAIVGDSFTAGEGCMPWIPKLSKHVSKTYRDVFIYNLGIPGTGFPNFRRILTKFDKELRFTDVVVVALSVDLARRTFRSFQTPQHLIFCPETNFVDLQSCMAKYGPRAWIIPGDIGKKEALQFARDPWHPFALPTSLLDRVQKSAKTILLSSKLLTFVISRLKPETFENRIGPSVSTEWINDLREIQRNFPGKKIHLIHLPDRYEVTSGQYREDIAPALKILGIEYYPALYETNWSFKDFHRNDGHPNCEGYGHISRYVEKLLVSRILHPRTLISKQAQTVQHRDAAPVTSCDSVVSHPSHSSSVGDYL
jgi:hypothetical protein